MAGHTPRKDEPIDRAAEAPPLPPLPTYEIRVRGDIARPQAGRFEGLAVRLDSDGESSVIGPVADQASLYGVLRKLRDTGMTLVSVSSSEAGPTEGPRDAKKEKTMIEKGNTSRVLGIAFLLQAITSLLSGVVFRPALAAPGGIGETMMRIAGRSLVMRASILCDMATALGIIFLGAVLYVTLRKHGEKIALTGFGFYILEAVLIASSRLDAFSLLGMSQEYAVAGGPDALPVLAKIASESEYFIGMKLAMVAFCPGALLLYFLLFRSRIIPRAISLWGFLAVFPCAIGTLCSALGYTSPILIALYIPYMPFEFTVGVWILIKGIKETQNRHDDRSSLDRRGLRTAARGDAPCDGTSTR